MTSSGEIMMRTVPLKAFIYFSFLSFLTQHAKEVCFPVGRNRGTLLLTNVHFVSQMTDHLPTDVKDNGENTVWELVAVRWQKVFCCRIKLGVKKKSFFYI